MAYKASGHVSKSLNDVSKPKKMVQHPIHLLVVKTMEQYVVVPILKYFVITTFDLWMSK